jgi:16S rRNA (cytosine1402-N4)-methyltransferase
MEKISVNHENTMSGNTHIPVLLRPALLYLAVKPDFWYVDATVGGGGYTTAILELGGKVLGIDADNNALDYARARIKEQFPNKQEGSDYVFIHANYRSIQTIIAEQKIHELAGIVFDCGFSSLQINDTIRGLSYRYDDAILDFRLDQSEGISTDMYLRSLSYEEMEEIIAKYGEESKSRLITTALMAARSKHKLSTVGDMKRAIASVIAEGLQQETNSRVFQAFRIAQNNEIENLKVALLGALSSLPVGGRLVIVSFHSLEDRAAKLTFRSSGVKELTHGPVLPDEEEQRENRRSRSAKLRAVEKV